MKGKRKLYTPQFKFKVVLESLQRDTTLEEICCKFGVSSSMISRWRRAFQQNGPGLFADQRDPMRRVMHTDGITAQSLRKKYVYRGLATEIVPNKLREEAFEWVGNEVVFSDILEVKLADGTGVRGCFALRHRTRQVLLIAFEYHMRADLITDAIETMAFEVPGSIWQSDEAHTLWGVPDPLLALAQRRMSLSMSRAGMPTDIGMRNALSAPSSWLELHVAPILRWGVFASG